MIAVAVAVLLLIGVLVRGCAGPLSRRLRPSLAVPLLTGLSLSVALCTGLVLSAVSVLVCAQFRPLSRLGQWSAPAVRAGSGVPVWVGVLAVLVVVVCLISAGARASWSVRDLISAGRAATLMRPVSGALVFVDDNTPTAYSVAGLRGRIVVSTSMLSALTGPERRVLIAHESAHLRHRHHLYLHLTRLAAAANPLLAPTTRAVAYAIERWADEDSATEVGDRSLTARALAHAALARSERSAPSHGLAAADDHVVERIRLLLAPPTPQRGLPIALIAVALIASWGTAAATTLWADNVIQAAESVYLHR